MSQFFVIQTEDPNSMAGDMRFSRIGSDHALSVAVQSLFINRSIPVWQVDPPAGAMDDLVNDARDSILKGLSIQETVLGRFLHTAIAQRKPFCLFWAMDFHDLPAPRTEPELYELITQQIQSDGSWSYEIYVSWQGKDPK